jgi:hypothetical protein
MINGVSAVTSGLNTALAQFEQAAGAVSSSVDAEAGSPDTEGMVTAQISMMSARLAYSASLVALRATTDMLADVLTIGGYGVSANDSR